MDRAEIEQTVTELLDAADRMQSLIVDVRALAVRLRDRVEG